jgi:hypothetical protein
MNESDMNLIVDMQREGLRSALAYLYSIVYETAMPNELLPHLEDAVEQSYRIGIETQSDILIAISEQRK